VFPSSHCVAQELRGFQPRLTAAKPVAFDRVPFRAVLLVRRLRDNLSIPLSALSSNGSIALRCWILDCDHIVNGHARSAIKLDHDNVTRLAKHVVAGNLGERVAVLLKPEKISRHRERSASS
jgi:hypothetical protein